MTPIQPCSPAKKQARTATVCLIVAAVMLFSAPGIVFLLPAIAFWPFLGVCFVAVVALLVCALVFGRRAQRAERNTRNQFVVIASIVLLAMEVVYLAFISWLIYCYSL